MLNRSTISLLQGLLLIVLSLEMGYALAINRTALVIGNSDYSSAPLKNPANDAKAMASSLRDLGFDVAEHTNLTRVEMQKAIRKFGNKLKKGGVGLFFFAGHGIQIKGKNYLIPIKTNIQEADEVMYGSIDASLVLSKMESAGNDFNIVIMDACRNNPFPAISRSVEQGLATMQGPKGSIIAYATAPGSTAADGTGKNGLYTSHFLKAMKEPGLSIEEVFKKVRKTVVEETDGKQVPWEHSSLIGDFQFSENIDSVEVATISPPPPPHVLTKASHLQVTANIPGGKVFVDGLERGIIAGNLVFNVQNLKTNEVEVYIEQTGYKSESQRVKLQPSEWRQAYFELIPEGQNSSTTKSNTSSSEDINRSAKLVQKKEKIIEQSKVVPNNKPKVLMGTQKQAIKSMDFNFGDKKISSTK